jgi:hypothetical protein
MKNEVSNESGYTKLTRINLSEFKNNSIFASHKDKECFLKVVNTE